MVERFPAAKGKRDAFDAIASAALDAIASSTKSSGSIARTESGSAGSEISWLSSSNSPVTNVEASAIVGIPGEQSLQADETNRTSLRVGELVGSAEFLSWMSTASDEVVHTDDLSLNPGVFQGTGSFSLSTWV